MKKIKSLGFVFALLLLLIVLVVARSTNKNLFKQEAQLAVDASKNGKQMISVSEIKDLKTDYLLIAFDASENLKALGINNITEILFSEILEKKNRKKLDNAKDKMILYSSDVSISAKAWVLLNQLGYKNLYILNAEENSEVLKYKFQPDTTVGLE